MTLSVSRNASEGAHVDARNDAREGATVDACIDSGFLRMFCLLAFFISFAAGIMSNSRVL